jgi:Spy/CpxP family protein refolding chaperone
MSASWESHFRRSLDNPPAIPWECARELTAAERDAIRSSIQEFQLGEQSEGRHLKRVATAYAERAGEPAYARAIHLFIREEQCHAGWLGIFMDMAGIPRIQRNWVDSVFRTLRRFTGGLETSIGVLLTAEVIATVYYDALMKATGNPALRAICRRILEDEAHHLAFQSGRIAILRRRRARWRIMAAVAAQWFLFSGSVAVVWCHHKSVFRLGGYSLLAYWLDCHRGFARTFNNPLHSPGNSVADSHVVRSMNSTLKLFTAAALTAGCILAQGPGGGLPPDPQTMIQRRVEMLANRLSLTDDQKTKATTIFTSEFEASQTIQQSLQTNRQSLTEAVKKNDTAAIDTLSNAAGNLSGQLTAISSKADAALYALLTADQQAKFDEAGARGPGGPRGGGPGAFGAARFGGRSR